MFISLDNNAISASLKVSFNTTSKSKSTYVMSFYRARSNYSVSIPQ